MSPNHLITFPFQFKTVKSPAFPSRRDSCITNSLCGIQTGLLISGRNVTRIAKTIASRISVDAFAIGTQVVSSLAFVQIDAVVVFVHCHAFWTLTCEGAQGVGAIAPVAKAWNEG